MVISARYSSTCPLCGAPIRPGDQINWERGRPATHVTCPQAKVAETPLKLRLTGEHRGAIQVGQTFRDRQHGIVTVVSVVPRFIREDGMSFGLMDESGWLFDVGARLASDDEARPILEREARAAERDRASKRLRELARQARKTWEQPARTPEGLTPEGERLIDKQNIYGGGDWWVVGTEHIWYVQNNGMDGDDWSRNNVRTGGAGAIGWRTPFDPTLAAELRQLAETLKQTRED